MIPIMIAARYDAALAPGFSAPRSTPLSAGRRDWTYPSIPTCQGDRRADIGEILERLLSSDAGEAT